MSSTLTPLTQDELYEALTRAVQHIEAAGASVQLTNASCLVSDIKRSLGNRWNVPDLYAANRVRHDNALSSYSSGIAASKPSKLDKVYVKEAPLTSDDWSGHQSIWVINKEYLKDNPNSPDGCLVTYIVKNGFEQRGTFITWEHALKTTLFSIDGRKTWKPCSRLVLVDPKSVTK